MLCYILEIQENRDVGLYLASQFNIYEETFQFLQMENENYYTYLTGVLSEFSDNTD